MRIYHVYEGEEIVFTGTAEEIKRKYNLKRSLGSYRTKQKLYRMHGRYIVKATDIIMNPQEKADWETLKMMLVNRRECFTQIYTDPKNYIGRLKDLGIEVRVTPSISYGVSGSGLTAPRRKSKPQKCWRVERV